MGEKYFSSKIFSTQLSRSELPEMQPSSRLCALENTPFIHEPSIDPRSAVGQLLMGVVLDIFLHNAVYFAIGYSRNSALENSS